MSDYYYEYNRDDTYCYPGSFVLKNKMNIIDETELKIAEREITVIRLAEILETPIKGKFDFKHFKAIHQYLFADIYIWAGKTRTVDIAKGNFFCRSEFIEEQATELFAKLHGELGFRGRAQDEVAKRLAFYLGEINAIHSFREGNGRVQRVFIDYVADNAGYDWDFGEISGEEMIKASDMAFKKDYRAMEEMFLRTLSKK